MVNVLLSMNEDGSEIIVVENLSKVSRIRRSSLFQGCLGEGCTNHPGITQHIYVLDIS